MTILIVDDDEDDYVLSRMALADVYGDRVGVDWVSSYEAAREALLGGGYGLCLMDYHLGARTGLELLREAAGRGCRTPVILLTGVDDIDVDVRATECGAADYLVKGQFDSRLLERSIRYAAERQRTLDALRCSEERYALAVRGANDGLWDWDLRTDRVYYAPRWKSILGYDDDQVTDCPQEWFGRINALDAERVEAEIAEHLAGRSPHFQSEHRMLHEDGSYRWVLTRGLAVRDGRGKAIRMAGSQSDITPRKAAEDRLQHDAFHDALTGLPNRALFLDRLGRVVERLGRHPGLLFGVLFCDLDGFKVVNDSLGHQTGDQVLIAVGKRLEGCTRRGDTVARLGGDEFVILLDGLAAVTEVQTLVDRILAELQAPLEVNGQELVLGASVGIALSGPNCGTAEELVRNADIAMYRAKSNGKAGSATFDESMQTLAASRLRMEIDLRQAAARDELRLFFQPIVSFGTGKVAGFEALLRWQRPDHGLVAPDDFIPLAEETKLIIPLGLWVIRSAVDQLKRWQGEFRTSPPLSMSVNLSCRQFLQPDLADQVERALLETGLDARCLRVEITESAIMEQVGPAASALAKLKSLGVKLAMDDFGKGYSSLSYLHEFPFDTLKIDRSFVSRIGAGGENTEIVRTIVSLAKSMGLDVVAEGVESESQAAQLRDLGCQYGQGYLFSRPLRAEAAADLLAKSPRWFAAADGEAAANGDVAGSPRSGVRPAGWRG